MTMTTNDEDVEELKAEAAKRVVAAAGTPELVTGFYSAVRAMERHLNGTTTPTPEQQATTQSAIRAHVDQLMDCWCRDVPWWRQRLAEEAAAGRPSGDPRTVGDCEPGGY